MRTIPKPVVTVCRRLMPLALVLALALLGGCRKSSPWSPDGRQVAVEAHGGIQLYDTVAGKFRVLVPGELRKREALAPAWSPDSGRMVFFEATAVGDHLTTSLESIEVATAKRTTLVRELLNTMPGNSEEDPLGPVRDYCSAAWSPDGREIAYVTVEGGRYVLWVVDPAGGRPRRLTPEGRQLAAPAWSPDSRYLAVAGAATEEGASWELELLERDGTNRRTLCRAPNGLELGSGPQWSLDGKLAGVIFRRAGAQAAGEPETCEAWLISIPDGGLRKLVDVPGPAWSASFTPDLRSVLFLQEADPGAGRPTATGAVLEPPYKQARTIPHPAGYDDATVTTPMISPDGKAVSVLIREGDKLPLLGLRYLDDRGPVDLTIPK
ncbi:MAG: Tol-Pal system protein TolB [Armatimonadetes bacterium]|jgi:Tol biopolymer transport system component|nr:Tol-Pal system protein TolB [Armatimonadota bacterium]